MEALENKTSITYINANDANAANEFTNVFHSLLRFHEKAYTDIIILCIGTDRATGDSLGPLVGHKLVSLIDDYTKKNRCSRVFSRVSIQGTLERPVHALNIYRTVSSIKDTYEWPLVVAVDASLGKQESIGFFTLGYGSISPGAGLNKNIPSIGDIFITGIVNYMGAVEMLILQNTRLHLVMKMADLLAVGIFEGLLKLYCDSC